MGKAKKTYKAETFRLNKKITQQLKQIQIVLPKNYTRKDILDYYKRYYPTDWFLLEDRQKNYIDKAKHLKTKRGYKKRYNTKDAESYFYLLPKVRHMMSESSRERHFKNFGSEDYKSKEEILKRKRKSKNEKSLLKRAKNREYTQLIDPLYLEIYIQMYHKKGSTNQEKLIIVNELMKYDSENVIKFLKKLNDAERNDMIRDKAFKHLQSLGYYVKLRKKFKGKKKQYYTEKSTLDYMKPIDLYQSLKGDGIHKENKYDVFISHSSNDKDLVREIIKKLNNKNMSCYCDWSLDNEFLKREYVSQYTKEVLKLRMEQSNELIYIRTTNSIKSDWVNFELEYFKGLNKKMAIMNIIDGNTELKEFNM